VEKYSITRQGHPHFDACPPCHQFPIRASKRNIKGHIHDCLMFPKLTTLPLTTTWIQVLSSIQGKDFLQHPPLIKDNSNIKNPNKFCLFHRDNRNDTEKCCTLKKKIGQLITRG
jgi:hypothetical protein